MREDTSIFGLRFGANIRLEPEQAALTQFLSSPKNPGEGRTHADDLQAYHRLLVSVSAFEQEHDISVRSVRDRMFYGVLGHSGFFTPALQSSVELYKYYLHLLFALDFHKPRSFIAAAELETKGLDPQNKSGADKLERLKVLVQDRKDTIKRLEWNKDELIRELECIAAYIRGNLIRITGLCEKAIIFLVQVQTEGSEEQRLISEIKTRFKQDLKEGLHRGAVTRRHLEVARQEVRHLSQEISKLLREDVFALGSVYEAVRDHAKVFADRIDEMLRAAGAVKVLGIDEIRQVFREMEDILVSLVSDIRITFTLTVQPGTGSGHAGILEQKREDMLASFFEHVRRERRTLDDRRTGRDRRTGQSFGYEGPEKRSGKERRSGQGRRRA